VLCAADAAGFDLCLYAERHLGADFEAWMLAAAISSWTRNIRAMPAVHPGLWHPTLIAKMASCLDRLTTGRMAINVVTGWNEVEARMFGGDILLHEDDRYIRAEEFIRVLRHVERDAVLVRRAILSSEGIAAPAQACDLVAPRDLHRQPERARARDGGEICGLVVPRL
jgi:alkanesulfonate monooxygenase SsuD/methylene tetrahydromethanopterin reductase-like flavin-dependent oxidoreductase (luciferase family)